MDDETRLLDGGGVHQGNDSITYVTLRAIEPCEELCISYGPKGRLTFDDVERHEDAEAPANNKQQPDSGMLEQITLGLDAD